MDKGKKQQSLSHELPWPKELSQGLFPGLIWAAMSFLLLLTNWTYGLISAAAMFLFFYSQRRTPIGRARRHYVQGRLAYRKENWQEALENFLKAVEIVPQAAAVYPVIGDLYFQYGELPKAKKAYQHYFQMKADDHHTRLWYAGKYMEHGMFDEAVKEIKKLPAEIRSELQVINLLSVCYLKTGQVREAVQILEHVATKSEKTDHLDLSARYLLGKAYIEMGEKEKARRILQRLDQDQPGFEDVASLLAML